MEARKLNRSIAVVVMLLLFSSLLMSFTVVSTPSFSAANTIAGSVSWPRSIYPCDIDNDGEIEVFTVRQGSGSETNSGYTGWYDNITTTPIFHSISIKSGMTILGHDFDGDGYMECVVNRYRSNELDVYNCNGNPSGSWTETVLISGAWVIGYVATLGDIDNDGEIDIIANSYSSNIVAWFRSYGDGTFSGAYTIDTTSVTRGLAVGDIDGDGWLDVVTNSGSSTTRWFRNDGTPIGGAWTDDTLVYDGINAVTISTGDMNGDGDIDIVCPDNGGSGFRWFENNGDGTSWTLHTIATGFSDGRKIVVADIDLDGDNDTIGCIETTPGRIEWYENTNGIGTTWSTHSLTNTFVGYGADVYAGDINLDGDDDVFACDKGSTATGTGAINDGAFVYFEQLGTPNSAPNITGENPGNGSTGNNLAFTWNITIYDLDGDLFNYTIECSNGQTGFSNGASNGSKTLNIAGLSYSTTYTVWVNATDLGSGLWTYGIYTFTTIPLVSLEILSISSKSNNSEIFDNTPLFEWTKTGSSLYWLQIANDTGFTDIVVSLNNLNTSNYPVEFNDAGATIFFTLPSLYALENKTYYVRVFSSI